MAVKLRLMRMGKKKQPTYRVVAADARAARNGRFIEIIGFYEPRRHPSVVKIDNERAVHWLSHGAQPTERVHKLLRISGAWDAFRNPQPPADASAPGDGGAADAGDKAGAAAGTAEAGAKPDAADAADAASAAAGTQDGDT